MARLFDRILGKGYSWSGEHVDWPEQWSPEIFLISNVADYFYDRVEDLVNVDDASRVRRTWSLQDFPNVAPPFVQTWMEFRWRRDWPLNDTIANVGVMAVARDVHPPAASIVQQKTKHTVSLQLGEGESADTLDVTFDTRWLVFYQLFVELTSGRIDVVQRTVMPSATQGQSRRRTKRSSSIRAIAA